MFSLFQDSLSAELAATLYSLLFDDKINPINQEASSMVPAARLDHGLEVKEENDMPAGSTVAASNTVATANIGEQAEPSIGTVQRISVEVQSDLHTEVEEKERNEQAMGAPAQLLYEENQRLQEECQEMIQKLKTVTRDYQLEVNIRTHVERENQTIKQREAEGLMGARRTEQQLSDLQTLFTKSEAQRRTAERESVMAEQAFQQIERELGMMRRDNSSHSQKEIEVLRDFRYRLGIAQQTYLASQERLILQDQLIRDLRQFREQDRHAAQFKIETLEQRIESMSSDVKANWEKAELEKRIRAEIELEQSRARVSELTRHQIELTNLRKEFELKERQLQEELRLAVENKETVKKDNAFYKKQAVKSHFTTSTQLRESRERIEALERELAETQATLTSLLTAKEEAEYTVLQLETALRQADSELKMLRVASSANLTGRQKPVLVSAVTPETTPESEGRETVARADAERTRNLVLAAKRRHEQENRAGHLSTKATHSSSEAAGGGSPERDSGSKRTALASVKNQPYS